MQHGFWGTKESSRMLLRAVLWSSWTWDHTVDDIDGALRSIKKRRHRSCGEESTVQSGNKWGLEPLEIIRGLYHLVGADLGMKSLLDDEDRRCYREALRNDKDGCPSEVCYVNRFENSKDEACDVWHISWIIFSDIREGHIHFRLEEGNNSNRDLPMCAKRGQKTKHHVDLAHMRFVASVIVLVIPPDSIMLLKIHNIK